ncbi:MAG: ComEC/Rec2 family competence protein [Alphaproteobacteria bacterium]
MPDQINRTIPSPNANFLDLFRARISWVNRSQGLLGFEWGTVAFACGIGLYFSLPFEPTLGYLVIPFVIVLGLCWYGKSRERAWLYLAIGLLLVVLGVMWGARHTASSETPRLPTYERAYTVTGWVAAIEASGTRTRWLLAVQNIEGRDSAQTPDYIRTSATGEGIRAGDSIRIRAVLGAPPPPVVPGGYDPGRAAYFKGIGGFGYSISKPEKLSDFDLKWPDRIQRAVVRARYTMAERIMTASPEHTAALQASLLTGIRTYIPKEQTEDLRIAGLAHILAISGLHMGLLAGGIYFMATLMLACVAPLSRRIDVRKPAAIIGGVAAASYLVLSGASVATQRAFIMALIIFLAVLLDRRALSIRSVAVAALITLIWHPEALMSAGFQMSFAAVAALVVVYRAWDAHRTQGQLGFIAKVRNAFLSLSVTSFVAGLATSGFAILHFNRMATYGLAGNLLAMPLFTFWVMPAAIAVFPAILIGQEDIPLAVMGKGLDWVLITANWVSGWSGALAHIPAAPGWVIGVYGLAFAGVCLGLALTRIVSCLAMIICVLFWTRAPLPDLRVSQDGAVSFWASGKQQTLYVDRRRADRYGREQFIRRAGADDPELELFKTSVASCDVMACRILLKGRVISVTANPSEVREECETSDVIILTQRFSGPVSRRKCQNAILIDKRKLNEEGALNIMLGAENNIKITPSITKGRRRRPWGQ